MEAVVTANRTVEEQGSILLEIKNMLCHHHKTVRYSIMPVTDSLYSFQFGCRFVISVVEMYSECQWSKVKMSRHTGV